ncbi:hypothetical protein N9I90_03855 [Alphaproteobacteria bacterium]|nr:hypothetical protein [Alphaproteobacteria bacterium]
MMRTKSSHKKRLFCDSELVFNKLVEMGVIMPDLPVFTRSFVIANNAAINSVYLDDKLSMGERQNFKAAISVTEKKLIAQLEKSSVPASEIFIFLQLFTGFQSDILDAMLLDTDAEFVGTSLIAVPRTGSPQIDEVLHPSWIDWMSGRKNVSLIDVNVPYHNERTPRGEVNASFADRLKLGGAEAILWKIAQQRWLPVWPSKKGAIGVVGQTEMARDAVASCLVNGFKPVFINEPKFKTGSVVADFKTAMTIIDACHSIILGRLSEISTPFLKVRAVTILQERLATQIGQYHYLLKAWSQQLAIYSDLECIISGYGKGPSAMAMADACQASGIKIAAFQHGITREILADANERRILYETSFCDLFFAMNPVAARITKDLCAIKSPETIPKNWPSPFKRISQKTSNNGKCILYVSTNLYSGHKPNRVPPASDGALCTFELALVENVFGNADKTIDYKPYPAIRQLDADPVIAAVDSQSNMSVIGTHEDLRYLLGRYEMFITSKATSTVSWLVATGKPLVFIDHICDARLSDEARHAFGESFFLFDQATKNFENSLKDFLQQSMADIHQQWQAKSVQRSAMVTQFFRGAKTDCRRTIFDDIKDKCMNIERNPRKTQGSRDSFSNH